MPKIQLQFDYKFLTKRDGFLTECGKHGENDKIKGEIAAARPARTTAATTACLPAPTGAQSCGTAHSRDKTAVCHRRPRRRDGKGSAGREANVRMAGLQIFL
jgi:hypothetical protein